MPHYNEGEKGGKEKLSKNSILFCYWIITAMYVQLMNTAYSMRR